MKDRRGRHGLGRTKRRALVRRASRTALRPIGVRLTVWALRLSLWGLRRALRRRVRSALPARRKAR
ncbi:hypothetical protein [Streptomyces sp. HUAS TT3]|uniref:hypothetical protein n=1 Tax=Streptomyces sp. HUAS TT3 TaxID=3447510 RepID=UPI003F654B08